MAREVWNNIREHIKISWLPGMRGRREDSAGQLGVDNAWDAFAGGQSSHGSDPVTTVASSPTYSAKSPGASEHNLPICVPEDRAAIDQGLPSTLISTSSAPLSSSRPQSWFASPDGRIYSEADTAMTQEHDRPPFPLVEDEIVFSHAQAPDGTTVFMRDILHPPQEMQRVASPSSAFDPGIDRSEHRLSTSQGRTSSAEPPSPLTRYYRTSGELENVALQIRNLEVDHSERATRREQLEDQGHILKVSNAAFERKFQRKLERLRRRYDRLVQDVEDRLIETVQAGHTIQERRHHTEDGLLGVLSPDTAVEAILHDFDVYPAGSQPSADELIWPAGLEVEHITHAQWTTDSPPPKDRAYDDSLVDAWITASQAGGIEEIPLLTADDGESDADESLPMTAWSEHFSTAILTSVQDELSLHGIDHRTI